MDFQTSRWNYTTPPHLHSEFLASILTGDQRDKPYHKLEKHNNNKNTRNKKEQSCKAGHSPHKIGFKMPRIHLCPEIHIIKYALNF